VSTLKRRQAPTCFALIAVSIFLSACVLRQIRIEIPPNAIGQPPKVTKLPLSVGVYYSVALRDHEHVFTPGLRPFVIRSGRASVNLFDQLLPLTFDRVVAVSHRPPLVAEGATVVAVLEPSIESLEVKLERRAVLSNLVAAAEVTYRFILHAPEGATVASWSVKGSGRGEGRRRFSPDQPFEAVLAELFEALSAAIHRAMHDAATKFMTNIREVPEVRQWLLTRGLPAAEVGRSASEGCAWLTRDDAVTSALGSCRHDKEAVHDFEVAGADR